MSDKRKKLLETFNEKVRAVYPPEDPKNNCIHYFLRDKPECLVHVFKFGYPQPISIKEMSALLEEGPGVLEKEAKRLVQRQELVEDFRILFPNKYF